MYSMHERGNENSGPFLLVTTVVKDFLIADAAVVFSDFVCGPIAISVAPSAMKSMLDMTRSPAMIVSPKELASLAAIINEVSLKVVIVMGTIAQKPENWPKRTC